MLAEIIKNCQKGNSEAFAWLLGEYGPRLYSYFYRTTGSPSEAEDMLQDLFVRLLQKIHAYKHQGKFEHWLFRVAGNMARDRNRKLSHKPREVSMQAGLQKSNSPESWLASQKQGPAEQAQHSEQAGMLQNALAQLSEVDRQIIMLRHYSNMSFNEIAQTMQMPIGTVLSKVHRGLKRLKKIMEQQQT